MIRRALSLLLVAGSAASAQSGYQSSPPRREAQARNWGPWLAPYRAKLAAVMMEDFGERYLYAEANRRLPPPRDDERRVVFLGDSITDKWDLAAGFPGKPYVNRGIGGQVTAQMLVRFQQDVVALKPAAVVILAGINDVHGVLQRETPEGTQANWRAMADIADRHGIRVVFGSILPVHGYTPAASTVIADRKPAVLRALNDWLQRFCAKRGYPFADYAAVLADRDGRLAREWSDDGIHPLPAAYRRMASVAEAAIAQALRGERPPG